MYVSSLSQFHKDPRRREPWWRGKQEERETGGEEDRKRRRGGEIGQCVLELEGICCGF
jgi:hypothetical protein